MLLRPLLLCLLLLTTGSSSAAEADPVLEVAERHIRSQTQGQSGTVRITLGRLDIGRLPACTEHEAYSPPGTRFVGKTYIGVRCLAPKPWSVLVPAQISIATTYVTTSRPLAAGQLISSGDLAVVSGDLANLPAGVIIDPQSAIGKTLRNSLGSGQALRTEQLLAPLVIRQGQTVRVISQGSGFSVTAEGKALNNAAEGQLAQIRMSSGQTVTGIARADGSVEITF